MKKLLYLCAGMLAFPLIGILVLLLVLFFEPTVIVNEQNINWVLKHTSMLESWTWQKMEINHQWKNWNKRRFTGDIRDLCFRYRKEMMIYSCFSRISWDFDLRFHFKEGISTHSYSPFTVYSPQMEAVLAKTTQKKEVSSPPDIYGIWKRVWSGMIPDLEIQLDSIAVTSEGKTTNLDFKLRKRRDYLTATVKDFLLLADPKGFLITGPEKIELPEKIETIGPFYFRNVKLAGSVSRRGIPLQLTGSLEEAAFDIKARLNLPVEEGFASLNFRRDFLATIFGQVSIPDFRETYRKRAPAAFRDLPAPLNVMTGTMIMNFKMEKGDPGNVNFHSTTNIELFSAEEDLDLSITGEAELPVEKLKPETISINLDFHKVKIELPKLSKKSPPPQFLPDKRFQKGAYRPPVDQPQETEIDLHLTALNRKSLHILTNLLDEPLRLNFDLLIGNGKIRKGHVTALPLKTEIFRRAVHVKSLVVTFNAPQDPVITAEIQFPLPEYKITLDLEGPVSEPRYAFRSEPPLPQNDIFAVLLFGRPLQDLDPDDKTAATKTNEILAQGILSLSVLYFLAGSPVEYVGFDPDSQNATAQFGLTDKTSLRVGGGREGMNSGGLRHSLGKGWYIDTTVQDNKSNAVERRSDYGVLLERVIAY